MSAYRLRERPGAESLAAAWDEALRFAPSRGPGNPDLLWHRAIHGVARRIVRDGKEVCIVVKPDDKALIKLHGRFARLARNIDRRGR